MIASAAPITKPKPACPSKARITWRSEASKYKLLSITGTQPLAAKKIAPAQNALANALIVSSRRSRFNKYRRLLFDVANNAIEFIEAMVPDNDSAAGPCLLNLNLCAKPLA